MRKILGIDTGAKGGLVLIDHKLRLVENQKPLPMQPRGELEVLDTDELEQFLLNLPAETYVFLEEISAAYALTGTAALSLGRCYGQVELLCYQNEERLRVRRIAPTTWSAKIHEGMSNDLKPKAKSRMAVEKLFPGHDFRATKRSRVPHEGLVDAALIAYYGSLMIEQEEKAAWTNYGL